jgi:hypothetical protein
MAEEANIRSSTKPLHLDTILFILSAGCKKTTVIHKRRQRIKVHDPFSALLIIRIAPNSPFTPINAIWGENEYLYAVFFSEKAKMAIIPGASKREGARQLCGHNPQALSR